MFRSTCCLLAVLYFPSSAVLGEDTPFSFQKRKSALAIPFELNSNKIYLHVRVDGGERRWFILDSGCPVTAIDLELARELKLPVEELGGIGGAGEGRTERGKTKVRSLTLPGLEVRPARVWALGGQQAGVPIRGTADRRLARGGLPRPVRGSHRLLQGQAGRARPGRAHAGERGRRGAP
jgi:hypothetical protein